ncbi:MAG: trypsin-like peptidase domain-containing protein [Bacillota bacterium]|nr:trypsin-like peptidase domain-containing protein [Bacillota bacterium]
MNDDERYYKNYPEQKVEPQSEDSQSASPERETVVQEMEVYPVCGSHGQEFDVTPKNDSFPKKKRSLGKKVAMFFCGIAAVAVIAFSSIGVYSVFFDKDSNDATPVTQNQTLQQTAASDGEALSVAAINEKVSPSVVGIAGESGAGTASGTGIIIKENGYIMTNAHVVSGMSNLTVTLQDGTEKSAELVGSDTYTDLAVIKIEGSGYTAAELGDSDQLVVGEEVVAIGNPLGQSFAGSVTNGIISALDRSVEIEGQTMHYIQTNAAINSGNSGGPLTNMQGQVIGINSAKIDTTVAEGMGFAIPINEAVPIVNELMEYGYVTGRPSIGISCSDINETAAAFYRVPTGAYVAAIAENGAAAKSDLRVGDIITSINGTEISSTSQLNGVKNQLKAGDTVELTVYRMATGETLTIKVKLTETDPETQEALQKQIEQQQQQQQQQQEQQQQQQQQQRDNGLGGLFGF